MRSHLVIIALALVAWPGSALAVAQPSDHLSSGEEALVAYVNQHFEEQISFLERVVNINSETMSHEGVRRVSRVFESAFKELGFSPRWIDLTETMNRAGHLVAERPGERGVRLLLIGHMDTVHPPDGPFQTFKRDGNRVTGPGVEDMKNGLVVMLFALRALADIGTLDGASITVFLTGEEEMPGESIKQARAPLVKAAREAEIALNFEPGEPGVAVTSRRGYTGWRLETSGQSSHSSQVFTEEIGAGAIYEMARILNRFYATLREEEALLTYNVGAVVGGTEASFDSHETAGEAFGAGPLEANDPRDRGASDISFAAPHVDAALDGLGGYGGGAHTTEEWLDLETMRHATQRAAVLLYRLTRTDAPQFEGLED